jgi:hypothetical protein
VGCGIAASFRRSEKLHGRGGGHIQAITEGRPLLYIAATDTAVIVVLVEERMEADTLKQFPIYYILEALSGSKLFYSEMDKMAYTVVMAKRKLWHYF